MAATDRLFRVLAAWLFAAAATVCAAGAGPGDPAEVTLMPGWRGADGSHVAAVRIALAPGWKTYWRAPGEAGIPPRFDAGGSENVAGMRVHWPVPEVFAQNGLASVGYEGGVILPVLVTPQRAGAPMRLRLEIEMGVCRDVCVPYRAELDGVLPAGGARDPAIAMALADGPMTGAEAGAGPLECSLEPTERGGVVTATLRLPAVGRDEHAVIEMADPGVWVGPAELARRGDVLTVRSRVAPPPGAPLTLDRSGLRLTVLGGSGVVDLQGCG